MSDKKIIQVYFVSEEKSGQSTSQFKNENEVVIVNRRFENSYPEVPQHQLLLFLKLMGLVYEKADEFHMSLFNCSPNPTESAYLLQAVKAVDPKRFKLNL